MRRLIFILLFWAAASIFGQEVLDKIIAVVDNEIILESELDYQVNMIAAQRQLDANDPKLRNQILNSLIEEKLLYAQAELDSITVSETEVDRQLDMQINYIIQQYGSRERIEEIYGMSLDKIRRELREDVRKNIMAQMVQNKKFGQVEVSRKKVEDFYNEFQDSLGVIPEKFEIAHIFLNPKAGSKLKNKAREFALSLLDSLKNGVDFAKLARKYSDDPGSSSSGGDLGFVKRGVFYPEFEAAAFGLNLGEISGLIESPVGFHIIELLERRGETIHARHILVKVKSDDEADLRAIEMLTEIRDSIVQNKNTFTYYSEKYSDDKNSARLGGVLGTFETGQLDKSLLDQIYKLKEGEIGYPKRLQVDNNTYGFHIIKLVRRIPEHKPNLETDYDELKRLADYNKKQELYVDWMKELKNQIYWEIKP
ncbi:MAG: parvulin peptidyl-prolyl isomerase [Ignavibacteria bacterium RBG_13_36_8]|nr:MAG: parvulin peptidyl-prolyl isomerase [Ignavibacteria bacterium RBG_13_36_8]